jgi:hypothetical protein
MPLSIEMKMPCIVWQSITPRLTRQVPSLELALLWPRRSRPKFAGDLGPRDQEPAHAREADRLLLGIVRIDAEQVEPGLLALSGGRESVSRANQSLRCGPALVQKAATCGASSSSMTAQTLEVTRWARRWAMPLEGEAQKPSTPSEATGKSRPWGKTRQKRGSLLMWRAIWLKKRRNYWQH